MAYSLSEIFSIHQKGQAVPGVRYHTVDGYTYEGTSAGRLRKITADVLELENEVAKINTTLTKVQKIVITTPEPVTPELLESYFELDTDIGVLMPVGAITNIVSGNIFALDTNIGALVPQEYDSLNTDIYFEYEGPGDLIKPKNI